MNLLVLELSFKSTGFAITALKAHTALKTHTALKANTALTKPLQLLQSLQFIGNVFMKKKLLKKVQIQLNARKKPRF